MSRCFCGCGRRLRFKGRVANVYGGNAQTLSEQVAALLDQSLWPRAAEAGLSEGDVRSILASLEDSRDSYRDVVHGDARLSQLDRTVWVARRDRALSVLAVAEERAIQDPEARRAMALGDWLGDEGLSENDPERVLTRMAELGEDDMERVLQGYEARRKDWSETGGLQAFRPDEGSDSDAA